MVPIATLEAGSLPSCASGACVRRKLQNEHRLLKCRCCNVDTALARRSIHGGAHRRMRTTCRHRELRSLALRRPAISLGAGAAHQHRALAVVEASGGAERIDGLLVV